MPVEKVCRVVLSSENIHLQEYESEGRLLTGDFWSKPDGFEFYYEMVRGGQVMLVEVPWEHFHGVLRLLAERIAWERGL